MARAIERLCALLDAAAADPASADAADIARQASEVFGTLRRTDMRSGVANIIRRLAQLHADGVQRVSAEGWSILRQASHLLSRGTLGPADVRALDEQLRGIGLDVDFRTSMPGHQPGATHPN